MSSAKLTYNFKKGDLIGTEAAEHDKEFLSNCFVDFGLLSVIKNCNKSQRIILGRTGSGKSALVLKLKEDEKNSIIFEPERMLFDNIINSKIINDLLNAKINLLPFFKLLWRHVFFIDFAINYLSWKEDEKSTSGFIQKIISQLPNKENELDKKYREAVDGYLEKYIDGKNFNIWISTQERIIEFVDKYQVALEAKISKIQGSASKNLDIKVNEKEKIQNIVSAEVNKDLNNVLDLTKKVLNNNRQKKYYIVIDKLDENWVSEKIRYTLIQALIETLVDYQESNFKIVMVLRHDLLQKVYMENKGNIQHEKYNAFHLNVNWTCEMLEEMIDKRFQVLTSNEIQRASDLFPEINCGRKKIHSLKYIFERTFLRPRDVISFVNTIIDILVSKRQKKITLTLIKEAEKIYSNGRFASLVQEWQNIYTNLKEVAVQLLKGSEECFRLSDLYSKLDDVKLEILTSKNENDKFYYLANSYNENKKDVFLIEILNIFYKVGLIGFKFPSEKLNYYYDKSESDKPNEQTKIYVHKMFHANFNVIPKK